MVRYSSFFYDLYDLDKEQDIIMQPQECSPATLKLIVQMLDQLPTLNTFFDKFLNIHDL